MLWALKDAPDVPSQCVGVLIGLAEHADKRGHGACPSTLTLSHYARKSERQARHDLDLLEKAGLIRLGDQSLAAYLPANRRPTVYDLAIERVSDLQSTAPHGVPRGSHDRREAALRKRRPDLQSTAPLNSDLQPAAGQDAPDLQKQPDLQSTAPQDAETLGCSPAQPGVQSTAGKPKYINQPVVQVAEGGSGGKPTRDINADREDADRLCTHLADRIEANGNKRPAVTKEWRDAARLLLDADNRTEDQAHKAIDWCQTSEFWRKNILSMPKLRTQYDRLRMDAEDELRRLAAGRPAASRQDLFDRARQREAAARPTPPIGELT